jgi:tetratricopeptide (TPR) repeat protein
MGDAQRKEGRLMSLLGKLFGARSLDQERAHADALFEQEQYGAAKLSYERAQSLAKQAPDIQAALAVRVLACRDAIGRNHLAEAERLRAAGSVDLARDELRQVGETAADPELLRAAEASLEKLERAEVRAELAQHAEPSEEDRFELIAGSFEDDQYTEYLAHGEPAKQALLALHDGRIPEARAALEALIHSADGPRYLWFELGRARLADGDSAGGAAALEKFLKTLHHDEGGDARLLAHSELAQQLQAAGDFDGAVAHYEAALTALPDDPRPYLAMASFFRREKLFDEAIDVLEAGLAALEDNVPDFRLWQELGLTLADAGRDAEATHWLERVITLLSSRKQVDLPPEGALRLAGLYERAGHTTRALDLYSLLAAGSDRPNLHIYHEHAARLMRSLDMPAEARRMLQRAAELAPDDAQTQERIASALSQLDSDQSAPP